MTCLSKVRHLLCLLLAMPIVHSADSKRAIARKSVIEQCCVEKHAIVWKLLEGTPLPEALCNLIVSYLGKGIYPVKTVTLPYTPGALALLSAKMIACTSPTEGNVIEIVDLEAGRVCVLKGHAGTVNCLLPLSSGKLASGSRDKSIKVWDYARKDGLWTKITKRCVCTLREDNIDDAVLHLSELPNNCIAAGYMHYVKVWNWVTQTRLRTFFTGGWIDHLLQSSQDTLVPGPSGHYFMRWGEGHARPVGHIPSVLCLLIWKNRYFSGCDDYSIKMCDYATGVCIRTFEDRHPALHSIIALPHDRIVSGAADYSMRVWDCATGTCLQEIAQGGDELMRLSDRQFASLNGRELVFWEDSLASEQRTYGEGAQ